MTTNVLLVGLTDGVISDARQQLLTMPDTQFIGGTGIDEVRSAFARARIDHVIIGGGLELEVRIEIAREIFRLSETATIHMKNRVPGPEGFVPFARSVLRGLMP